MAKVARRAVRDWMEILEGLNSIPEAARKLRAAVPTVNSWLTQGRLTRTKVGGRTYISNRAIAEFLAKCNE